VTFASVVVATSQRGAEATPVPAFDDDALADTGFGRGDRKQKRGERDALARPACPSAPAERPDLVGVALRGEIIGEAYLADAHLL